MTSDLRGKSITRGDAVEVTVGARDGQRGIVAEVVKDDRYRIVLVAFGPGETAWYGPDELVAS